MLSYQYRMDETTAPTEAQMKLAISQTLSMPFAYNAPVVVLSFEVDENGGITGNFKDAARPRVFTFELDGESVSYSPYKPGKMDSLDSEDGVIEWEEFSAGYSYRVDAGIGTGKKPQCVKPTAYNCGAACINVMKNCKINTKDAVSKDRLKKLKGLAMSYYKEFEKLDKTERGSDKQKEFGDKSNQASRKRLALMEQAKSKKGIKSKESQVKPKTESKKPSGQKSTAKKTVEPEVKTEPKTEPKPETKSTPKSKANPFYSDEPIKDYDTFKKEIVKEAARVAFEKNTEDSVSIAQMRHELRDRVNPKDFDKWIIEAHGDEIGFELTSEAPSNEKQRTREGKDPNAPFDISDGVINAMGSKKTYISIQDKEAIEKAKKEFKRKPGQISDPKDFEKEVMPILDAVNKKGNHEGFVPIYEIRDAMGDKVSRGDFNNLMNEMVRKGMFEMQGGEIRGEVLARGADGVKPPTGNSRFYVKMNSKK